jgi:hypothetical protein
MVAHDPHPRPLHHQGAGPPFAIGVGVFTFLLVIDRIYQLADLVITKSVPFALVMPLLVYAPRLPRPHPADGDAGGGAAGGGARERHLEVAALKAAAVSPLRPFRPFLAAGIGITLLIAPSAPRSTSS